MPRSRVATCTTCGGVKDARAIECRACRFKSRHPRSFTGTIESVYRNGYVYVNMGRGVPKLKHRLVYETYLGRPLLSNEHIHHKDGDRLNNDLSNLEMFTHSEHARLHLTKERAKEMSILGIEARWGKKDASNL